MRQRRTYQAIKEWHEEQGFPIEAACRLLHVARSAYYKWAVGKRSRRAVENEQLANTIEKSTQKVQIRAIGGSTTTCATTMESMSMIREYCVFAGPEMFGLP